MNQIHSLLQTFSKRKSLLFIPGSECTSVWVDRYTPVSTTFEGEGERGLGDSSTRTKFYYYSSWLPLISPGVYQLAQILINSIKYLQTCFSIHYRLVSLQPRAIPEFVYKCQVHVHVLSISQRGITLTERKNYQQSNMKHLIAQRILKQLIPCYYMNSNNIFIMARYIYSVHKVWDRLGIMLCNFEPPWSLMPKLWLTGVFINTDDTASTPASDWFM